MHNQSLPRTKLVRCDKKSPCSRCLRRGTICTAQSRKRGRPAKEDQPSWVHDSHDSNYPQAMKSDRPGGQWATNIKHKSNAKHRQGFGMEAGAAQHNALGPHGRGPGRALQNGRMVVNGSGHASQSAADKSVEQSGPKDRDLNFLELVRQWLGLDPMPHDETARAAVVMQSFMQGLLDNERAAAVLKGVCSQLHIDSAECERWCRFRAQDLAVTSGTHDETFVLHIHHMQLPPYISGLTKLETAPLFVYAYHNGHQTYAANDKWDTDFITAHGLQRSSFTGVYWTFMDCLAMSMVEHADRREFLAVGADLLIRGKAPREERQCVVMCKNKNEPQGKHKPCLITMRLWSDTGTESFIFALQVIIMPRSKYVQQSLESVRKPREPPAPKVIVDSQRLLQQKKWNNQWTVERELLTEEQLLASMLPLDEVLELDDFDIEAVAEHLHG